MIDKWDIMSIQGKMNLKGPKSMRTVDDLSIIFIDFYVPMLTPGVSSTETITLFVVCHIYAGMISKVT